MKQTKRKRIENVDRTGYQSQFIFIVCIAFVLCIRTLFIFTVFDA